MSDPYDAHSVPRLPLAGAGALVLLSLAAVAVLRLTGMPPLTVTPSPVTSDRQLAFTDAAGGGVDVTDARSGARIAHLAPGSDGFIRATVRTLVRERRARQQGAETPFLLARHADGRLTLADPATGRSVNLEAFGPGNAGAFARLLAAPPLR